MRPALSFSCPKATAKLQKLPDSGTGNQTDEPTLLYDDKPALPFAGHLF